MVRADRGRPRDSAAAAVVFSALAASAAAHRQHPALAEIVRRPAGQRAVPALALVAASVAAIADAAGAVAGTGPAGHTRRAEPGIAHRGAGRSQRLNERIDLTRIRLRAATYALGCRQR